jgi:Zinc-finger of C2H2 type
VIQPCHVQLNLLKSAEKNAGRLEKEESNFTSCGFCGLKFNGWKGLHAHSIRLHQSVSTFRCDVCFIYFTNDVEMEKHQEENHSDVLLHKCIYCTGGVFRSKERLRLHVEKLHKNEVIFWCKHRRYCCMYFHSEEEKAEHDRTVHCKRSKKCLYCDAVFSSLSSVRRHLRKYHTDIPFRCPYSGRCAKYFHSEEERAKHVKEVHEGVGMKQCPFCPFMFRFLPRHTRIHHKDKLLFTCSFNRCKKSFYSENVLRNHEIKKHMNKGLKSQTWCIFCCKNVLKSTIRYHLQSKHQSQLASAFKCNFHSSCSLYFLAKIELEEHVKSAHLKLQLVKCIYCNKKLKLKQLNMHVHNKHYKTQIKCPKRGCLNFFLSQMECDKHFSQHHQEYENNRIFKCESCNFSTANAGYLKIHKGNVHHGNLQVKCPKCPKFFHSHNLLGAHARKKHAV